MNQCMINNITKKSQEKVICEDVDLKKGLIFNDFITRRLKRIKLLKLEDINALNYKTEITQYK